MKRILPLLLILCLAGTAAATEYNYQAGALTGTGGTIKNAEYTFKLVDFTTNSDGIHDTLLIDVYTGDIKINSVVLDIGKTYTSEKGEYKIKFSKYLNKKFVIETRAVETPHFDISAETTSLGSYDKYDYETTIKTTCKNAPASGVVVTWDSADIDLKNELTKTRYNPLKKGDSPDDITIKYTRFPASKLIMNIEYKDELGSEHTQTFNVLENAPVPAAPPQKQARPYTGYRVIHRHPPDYYAKQAFIRAIDAALIKIEFTEEEENQLKNIKESLQNE